MYEGRPFRVCTACGESLAEFDNGYHINKTFHGSEVIMEYALCFPCYQNLVQEFSEASIRSLVDFQSSRSRQPENEPEEDYDYECEFCERTRWQAVEEKKQYALAALCMGRNLIERPVLACEECMLEMNECISEPTRKRWRDFVDDHFPGVPADALPDPHSLPMV